MVSFFLVFFALLCFATSEDCQTATQQPGKCVLINHCPHLFSATLKNETKETKNNIKKHHCGFEAIIFPKVCCPVDAVEYYEEGGVISNNQHATKCGYHMPNGPSDPWLALLEYEKMDGQKEFLCAGILINKRYLLTAAHCIVGPNAKLKNVHFGKSDGKSDSQLVVPVDSATVHEEYDPFNPNQYNDIALVRLKTKILFKDGSIKPICVPNYKTKNFIGKTLYVTGYENLETSFKKRDGVATVWNNTECHISYQETQVKLEESQMCAGGKRIHFRHSHKFDFGGFLMHSSKDNTYSIVGILSLKPKCCGNENSPKVFTRIPSYIEWIINNLKP